MPSIRLIRAVRSAQKLGMTSLLVSYELANCQERKRLAATLGIESQALRLRVHRVRQSLRQAVQTHALQRTDLMPQMAA